jgi:hypothetical protein
LFFFFFAPQFKFNLMKYLLFTSFFMVSTLFYGQNGFNVAVDFSGLNNSRTVNYYVYTNAYNANLEYDTSVLFGYPEKRNGLRSVSDNNFIGISADYTYFFTDHIFGGVGLGYHFSSQGLGSMWSYFGQLGGQFGIEKIEKLKFEPSLRLGYRVASLLSYTSTSAGDYEPYFLQSLEYSIGIANYMIGLDFRTKYQITDNFDVFLSVGGVISPSKRYEIPVGNLPLFQQSADGSLSNPTRYLYKTLGMSSFNVSLGVSF